MDFLYYNCVQTDNNLQTDIIIINIIYNIIIVINIIIIIIIFPYPSPSITFKAFWSSFTNQPL